MKRYFALLLFITLLSCSSNKLLDSLRGGEVAQEGFYQVLPFEYKRNEIFVSVKINGVPATFIVDTGAPNLITKDFQSRLGLKAKFNHQVGDSRNRKQKRSFVLLEEVDLGGLKFKQTIAAVADFSKAPEIGCFGVDGFIGANLMRKAYWQIDYQKQTIIITDQYEKLGDLSGGTRMAFDERPQGTPVILLNLADRIKTKLRLDTGSTGELSLNARYLKKIKGPRFYELGYTSSGLSGAQQDTTFSVEAEEVWLGELQRKKQVLRGDRNASNLIGNQFLDDFLVTIDWVKKEVILIPKKDARTKSPTTYGFSVRYGKENLIVSGVIGGSQAQLQGLKPEDIILQINDQDYTSLPYEEYCRKAMGNEILPETGELSVKVRRKASSEELMIKLKRYSPLGKSDKKE